MRLPSFHNVIVIKRGIALPLILVFSTAGSGLSGEVKAQTNKNQTRCEPIGRILTKGDLRLGIGNLLCRGDQLQLPPGVVVDVLCFVNRQVLTLSNGIVANQPRRCIPPPKEMGRSCPQGTKVCYKAKGPGLHPDAPLLNQPYGSKLIEDRPFLAWTAVPGATSYTVTVSGTDLIWSRTTETTELNYPHNEASLMPGGNYKIVLLTNMGASPVAANEFVFRMLPQADNEKLTVLIKQVKALNLPPDEAAYLDLDALYMSQELLNATIMTLEGRVKAGSRNPTLYRVLGDRYLEAGLPAKAKETYQQASQMAQAAANTLEYNRAKQGLAKAARHSQLPTNINGAQ